MSSVFTNLPRFVSGYGPGMSISSSPITLSDENTLGSMSESYPGQTPFSSPVLGPLDPPIVANSNLLEIERWREEVYMLRARGINETPEFGPITVSPTFARAPPPVDAPPVSYTLAAAAARLRAGDEGHALYVEQVATPAVQERERRPYAILGSQFPRFDPRTGNELPTQPPHTAPLSIAWQPLKVPTEPLSVEAALPTAASRFSPPPRTRAAFAPPPPRFDSRYGREVTRASPIFKTISELQNISHAYMSTVNRLSRLSAIERERVQYVIDLLKVRDREPDYLAAVEWVIRAAIHPFGIDYLFRLYNGQEVWLRDIDLWRSPNARATVARYWGLRKTPLPDAEIERLLTLPQYDAQDGRFLQNMRARVKKGTFIAPELARD